tara:strand:+ start:586 stop:1062 length:477 start_codon:yes stop_codon:yes gene_type:complete
MAYLDVITLAEAKTYLRVDDTLTDDDTQISRMIKSALSTIEKRTNILVYARSKNYLFQDYCVSVYDFPINSVTLPLTDDVTIVEKTLYTNYEAHKSTDKTLTLNVGYTDPLDVPYELIDCALQYVKYLYYEAETDKANKGLLPYWLQDIINQNKRYIL